MRPDCSLGALRPRLSTGLPLSRPSAEGAILPVSLVVRQNEGGLLVPYVSVVTHVSVVKRCRLAITPIVNGGTQCVNMRRIAPACILLH